MTESEARERPISEVWEHFRYLVIDAIPHLNECISYYNGSETHLSDYQNQLDGCNRDAAMLRAVLLDRCGQIWDADGVDTQIAIFKTPSMDCIRVDQGKYVRYDNYETCLNMSAAYAFWAWELKQRQNEVQKG